jgi:sulfite exporter TauE/SafE
MDLYGFTWIYMAITVNNCVHWCDHLQTCLVDAFQAMDESQDGLINEVLLNTGRMTEGYAERTYSLDYMFPTC